MGQQQREEHEQKAAGVEAPGQQKSCGENSIVIEGDGSGGQGSESPLEDHGGGKQDNAAGHDQRLERF